MGEVLEHIQKMSFQREAQKHVPDMGLQREDQMFMTTILMEDPEFMTPIPVNPEPKVGKL